MWRNVMPIRLMRLKCWAGKPSWALKECVKMLGVGSRRIRMGMVRCAVSLRGAQRRGNLPPNMPVKDRHGLRPRDDVALVGDRHASLALT